MFLTVITGREHKDAILKALLETGIHLINTVYGKSTYTAGYLKSTFALIPEMNRVVITGVSSHIKVDIALKMLIEKFNFEKPHTGVAFTIPVDGISF